MAFTRRVSRWIVWVGGTCLVLAAAASLLQGSSPVDWDLHNAHIHLRKNVEHGVGHAEHYVQNHLQGRAVQVDPATQTTAATTLLPRPRPRPRPHPRPRPRFPHSPASG